jgi:hypothetical protein
MTASQLREMTLNNENNNQSTVNQTLGARLKKLVHEFSEAPSLQVKNVSSS